MSHVEKFGIYFSLLAIIVLNVQHVLADLRMHRAHAHMIGLIFDNLIAEKKAEIVPLMDEYLKQNSLVH